jgi:hypothetical protein
MRHIRAAKLCSPGVRVWWKQQGFDWNDFLTNGIEAERLIETGDPVAMRPVEAARAEQHGR